MLSNDNSEVLDAPSHEVESSPSNCGSDYTPEWERARPRKMKYRVITEEQRRTLINLIQEEGFSISKAAKKTGIKYSTAKTIYSVYLQEGRINSKLRRGVGSKKPMKSVEKKLNMKTKVSKTTTAVENITPTHEGLRHPSTELTVRVSEESNFASGKTNQRVEFKEPSLLKKIKTEEQDGSRVLSQTLNKIERPESISGKLVEPQINMPSLSGNVQSQSQALPHKTNHLLMTGLLSSTYPQTQNYSSLESLKYWLLNDISSLQHFGVSSNNASNFRNIMHQNFLNNLLYNSSYSSFLSPSQGFRWQ